MNKIEQFAEIMMSFGYSNREVASLLLKMLDEISKDQDMIHTTYQLVEEFPCDPPDDSATYPQTQGNAHKEVE